MATLMAGIAAEELIYGQPSTGCEEDLQRATDLATDVAARYGMSPRLGRARLLARDVDAFLDAEVPLAAISGHTHQELDGEVRRLLNEAERHATAVLITHRSVLDDVAGRLEVAETLEASELEPLLTVVQPEVELFGGMPSSSSITSSVPQPATKG
jgi:cell division protease FtsH